METAVELIRQAIYLGLLLSAPVLAVSIAVGLVTAILQAVTQVQEQTLSFVPRLVVAALTVLALLPWSIERMTEYATSLYQESLSTF